MFHSTYICHVLSHSMQYQHGQVVRLSPLWFYREGQAEQAKHLHGYVHHLTLFSNYNVTKEFVRICIMFQKHTKQFRVFQFFTNIGWFFTYSYQSISSGAQQKYFSHPCLCMYSFATPPIKLKLEQQMGVGLLIANHLD